MTIFSVGGIRLHYLNFTRVVAYLYLPYYQV